MRIFNLAIVLLPLLEAATPVNLHLDATFASPPFLLELLEAAATEKPECYFQLIPHLVSLPRNTDRELYNAALPLISSCLGDPASVELFKLSVSLRSATPKIEAVYQYYDHSEIEKPPCDSWFLIEGTGLCELPKNMPESSRKDRKLLRMDRIYPTLNHEKPAVIYYADLTDPTFLDHHESLIALSRQNKIRYVLRYKSPKIRSVRKVSLSGYGVEMALKKMDYLVIDDREDGEHEGEPRSLPGKDESTSTIQPLRISELAQLGPKAISYIINSENPLNKLLETSRNLPSLTSVLSKYNSSSKVIQEIDKLNGHAYPPGQNMLWINGRQIDSADITIYSLLQFLRYERDMISSLSSLGLSTVKSRDLLTNPAIATYYETISSQRFDFRDSVIIYFNNIENDKLYASWSQSLSTFLTPIYPGQLHTVRRNFHTLVVSINLSDDDEVNGILGRLWSIVQRKIALRIGIILETDTPRSRAFVWIYQEKGLDKALEFLSNVLPDNTSDKKAFENVVGRWGKPKFDDAIVSQNVNDHFSKNNDWLSRFSFQHGGVFFNGRFIQKSDNFLNIMGPFIRDDTAQMIHAVQEEKISDDISDLLDLYLSSAPKVRNRWIFPEEEHRIVDLVKALQGNVCVAVPDLSDDFSVTMWIIDDYSTELGKKIQSQVDRLISTQSESRFILVDTSKVDDCSSLVEKFGLKKSDKAIVINGRVIGPFAPDEEFTGEDIELLLHQEFERITPIISATKGLSYLGSRADFLAKLASILNLAAAKQDNGIFESEDHIRRKPYENFDAEYTSFTSGGNDGWLQVVGVVDPLSEIAQRMSELLKVLSEMDGVGVQVFLNPKKHMKELPVGRYYRYVLSSEINFNDDGSIATPEALFDDLPQDPLFTLGLEVPHPWLVMQKESIHDLDNIRLANLPSVSAVYELKYLLVDGHAKDITNNSPPRGVQFVLGNDKNEHILDTIVMANLGYFQFKASPGIWKLTTLKGRSSEIFDIVEIDHFNNFQTIELTSFDGMTLFPKLSRKHGMEGEDVLAHESESSIRQGVIKSKQADINIFSVASGHLYERFIYIMILSVKKHTASSVKFWFIENFLSPSFKIFIPHLAAKYDFEYEYVTYKWPHWLRHQKEKQREIWGYKILFLDVLFPLSLDKVIFVDADQIVRIDLQELVDLDLHGAPYGYTPMGDSREEMDEYRFWKSGYWRDYLKGKPYHISALYVIDLKRFRQLAAGDLLRGHYQSLSSDPNSLANLDQDLPNHLQHQLPIFSLDKSWLWCETWCSDEDLKTAKTIDLCNNPKTKEPKLDRARRQIPEWNDYDSQVAALAKQVKNVGNIAADVDAVQKPDDILASAGDTTQPKEARNRDEL